MDTISLGARRALGIDNAAEVTLFVSEAFEGDLHEDGKPMNQFSEYDVFREIRTKTEGVGQHLFVKMHPSESFGKYGFDGESFSYLEALDFPSLAVFADRVIGMGSMLLTEIAAFRGDVVSYAPVEASEMYGPGIEHIRVVRGDIDSAFENIPHRQTGDFFSRFDRSAVNVVETIAGVF